MLRIKMNALYDHFPEHKYVEGEPYIECYSDSFVKLCTSPGKNIALLLEPRSMVGEYYDFVYENHDFFKYIFTHDSKLLTLPNSRLMMWNEVWRISDQPKTKGISLVSSWKNWCPLHIARIELARQLKNSEKVDCFGSFDDRNAQWFEVSETHDPYKFAIVIENDIDDYWYTEKILNCFGTKTVPIYVGSKKIGDFFNADGIIEVDDWRTIPDLVKNLDIDAEYEKRLPAINDNFGRLEPYKVGWKERFFRDYGELMEEVQNG